MFSPLLCWFPGSFQLVSSLSPPTAQPQGHPGPFLPAGPQGCVWYVCSTPAPQILVERLLWLRPPPLCAFSSFRVPFIPTFHSDASQVCEHSIYISSARLLSQMAAPARPKPQLLFRFIPTLQTHSRPMYPQHAASAALECLPVLLV